MNEGEKNKKYTIVILILCLICVKIEQIKFDFCTNWSTKRIYSDVMTVIGISKFSFKGHSSKPLTN